MTPAEFISKKLKLDSKTDPKNNLDHIISLFKSGLSVGEVCFDPVVWSDKKINMWSCDAALQAYEAYRNFEIKKEKYIKDIETRKTPIEGLGEKLLKAKSLKSLENIFRPYKRRKKTKASLAREAGLEVFTKDLLEKAQAGETFEKGLESEAKKYIQPALGFITYEIVLKGARDILVEQALLDNPSLRDELLEEVTKNSKVVIKPGDKYVEAGRFSAFIKAPAQKGDYYLNPNNFDKFPRIKKAWEDGHLKVTLDFDSKSSVEKFEEVFVKKEAAGDLADFLRTCARKAMDVHVLPSVTTEFFDSFFEISKEQHLLKLKTDYISLITTPAFGEKPVLSVFGQGEEKASVVLVSHSGEFISETTLDLSKEAAVDTIKELLAGIYKSIDLGAVVLPMGKKSRDHEKVFSKALEALGKKEMTPVVMSDPRGLLQFINSEEAKFGVEGKKSNAALTAYRLGKRAQDPLFEYADHLPSGLLDVPAFLDKESVDASLVKVLSYYVCAVGINNKKAGLGLFKNLGWFEDSAMEERDLAQVCKELISLKLSEKKDLEKVLSVKDMSRFSKYFKVTKSLNLLDASRVSIDSFSKVKDCLKEKDISLLKGPIEKLSEKIDEKEKSLLGEEFSKYIFDELSGPFKDFRRTYKVFGFSKGVEDLKDVQEDNLHWGVVTKFSPFGAFVDIGVGVEGLIHLSELANSFVADPRKVLRLSQWVLVKVIKVDVDGKKLSFSKTKAELKQNKNSKVSGNKKFSKKEKFEKRKSSGQSNRKSGSQAFKPRKPKNPFNNPFAALGDIDLKG